MFMKKDTINNKTVNSVPHMGLFQGMGQKEVTYE